MLSAILYAILVVSLIVILTLLFSIGRKHSVSQKLIRFPIILFALWLVATAVWERYFFEIQLGGFFDFTIARFLLILVVATLVAGLFTGRVNLRKGITIELGMLTFSILCVLSMLQHGFRSAMPGYPTPWVVFIWGYLFPFGAFLYVKYFFREEHEVAFLFYVLFFFGVYLSCIAWLEFFHFPALIFPRYIVDPQFSIHALRAKGPLLNAAFNGVGMIVGFVCGVHLLQTKQGGAKLVFAGLLALFLPAIFFTQTRSNYLGFLIAAAVLLVFYRTRFSKVKVFAMPMFLVFILVLANAPRIASTDRRQGGVLQLEEVRIRFGLVQRSFMMLMDGPFLGVGLGQFIPVSLRTYRGRVGMIASTAEEAAVQHNHLLGLTVELGMAGIMVYLLIIAFILRRCWQMAETLPQQGFWGVNLILVIVIVWCVYFNNNLFTEPSHCLFINLLPFTFAGIADGLYRRGVVERTGCTAPLDSV